MTAVPVPWSPRQHRYLKPLNAALQLRAGFEAHALEAPHHSEARGSAPRVPESLIGAALDLVARWEAGITPA